MSSRPFQAVSNSGLAAHLSTVHMQFGYTIYVLACDMQLRIMLKGNPCRFAEHFDLERQMLFKLKQGGSYMPHTPPPCIG